MTCRARVGGCSSSPARARLSRTRRCPLPVAVALLTFEEQVRPDAADTMRYFQSQDVGLRVISGDNPRTVGAIAARVGVPKADEPVDARTLPEDQAELADVLDTRTVFGRVTPNQKRAFVHALQEKAHVVAMTGDGVNDALALKDADIGVAMGNGAPATRAVAQIVLLDGRFSQLPRGRRRPAGHRQHRAGRQPVPHQERVLRGAGGDGGHRRRAVPVPPPPPDAGQHAHHRVPAFVLSLAPSNERYRLASSIECWRCRCRRASSRPSP